MSNRLIDTVKENKIATEVEKLADFENVEFTLRDFTIQPGSFERDYLILDVVDSDGVQHMLSTGGETILRILKHIDKETALPAVVKFVKVQSGTGRKVWSIE